MTKKIVVLPGDGIGPEVTKEAVKVLKAARSDLTFEEALIGGTAYDDCGDPLPDATLELCKSSDAALLGAVGGPKWDSVQPLSKRPEIGGLLRLRGELELFANIRPAKTLKPLLHASPLRDGAMDVVVVRELTGGIYFGKPRERRGDTAIDTCVYSVPEVERITKVAIDIARTRGKKITSVDKANVLETSRLWREVVDRFAQKNPDISFSHMLVDNCAMQLVRNPAQFDVILTGNMFGDILSDEASMVTGSLGLLPSASLGSTKFGVYEPIHGSAPDIAGQGKANPLATILSTAMMLRFSLDDSATADRIEAAVESALQDGYRTVDIKEDGCKLVSTREMGDAVASNVS
ncbi:MAG TPA: 3-isopropylmalate dehydrogenase [Fimbriimonadaceae bacterium]|nr:3-isopropylmalate dehydrogenase [Fimbriimonadaceae bacterium]